MLDDKQPRRKIILIVESNEQRAHLLKAVIAQETAHRAVVVPTGRQALNALQSVIPDLVLFNHHLSDMRGMELYEQIRTVDRLKSVPLLMIGADKTTRGDRFLRLRSPFERDAFLSALEELMIS